MISNSLKKKHLIILIMLLNLKWLSISFSVWVFDQFLMSGPLITSSHLSYYSLDFHVSECGMMMRVIFYLEILQHRFRIVLFPQWLVHAASFLNREATYSRFNLKAAYSRFNPKEIHLSSSTFSLVYNNEVTAIKRAPRAQSTVI